MGQPDSAAVFYSTLEETYLARDGVDLRRSLNGAGLAIDGRIFAFLDDDVLTVHLGSAGAGVAIAAGDGDRYTLGSRVLRAWLRIPFDAGPERWERYLEQAYDHSRGISNS